MAGSYKHSNAPVGSTELGEFPEYMSRLLCF
jgi:hypothetical protein